MVQPREQNFAAANTVAERSDQRATVEEWKLLWKLEVPSTIRIFLWRLARHSLPSKDVLLHRNIADDSACSLCGMEDSWKHSLLECSMARCVWALEKESIVKFISDIMEMEAKSWLSTAFGALSREDGKRVAVTLWAIWYTRWRAIHDHEFQSPLSTHCFVNRFMEDLVEDKPLQAPATPAVR